MILAVGISGTKVEICVCILPDFDIQNVRQADNGLWKMLCLCVGRKLWYWNKSTWRSLHRMRLVFPQPDLNSQRAKIQEHR